MADINHPHKNVIDNYENIYPMISLISESKITYVREKLNIHLHAGQIKLLKEANKHQKPHHRKLRVNTYQNNKEELENNSLFELHKKLYIKKYQKLENKGLVVVDTETDELPYDVLLTDEGKKLLEDIDQLEHEWEDEVLKDVEDKDKLLEQIKQIANNALPINYNHKKQQKFVF